MESSQIWRTNISMLLVVCVVCSLILQGKLLSNNTV